MPRYFFHRTDGHFDRDEEGVEFPSIQAARNAAVIFAGETLRDMPQLVWKNEELTVEVTDVNSLILFSVHITTTQPPDDEASVKL